MKLSPILLLVLRQLYPRSHEALIGDLLEGVSGGRPRRWLYRELAVAVMLGLLPAQQQVLCALLGTMFAAGGGLAFSESGAALQLWMWSREASEPLSAPLFVAGQAAMLSLVWLPALAAAAWRNGAFTWTVLCRGLASGLVLFLAASPVMLYVLRQSSNHWWGAAAGIVTTFLVLLVCVRMSLLAQHETAAAGPEQSSRNG